MICITPGCENLQQIWYTITTFSPVLQLLLSNGKRPFADTYMLLVQI